jgi:hypothetical protein
MLAPMSVEIWVGEATKLELDGPEDLLDRLTAEVDGGALTLEVEGCVRTDGRSLRARLWTRRLDRIDVGGSGDVTLMSRVSGKRFSIDIDGSGRVHGDVAVDDLDIRIDGSGEVCVAGTADETTIRIAGSGDVDADRVDSERARVHIAGSGNVKVRASRELDAAIDGVGDVRYRGRPRKVTRRVTGTGVVRAQE